MSRNISFCGYTILEHGPMIVRDATADIRFADNPLVTCKPNIRFYAGMPLITPDGYALGTLCVLDQAPKELTEMQERGLRVLARFVMTQLDIRRHTRNQENVVAKLQKLEMELKHARAQLEQAEKELAPHT
jgi:GAF domain-containing protein